MSRRDEAIKRLTQPFEGRGHDARYLGFLDCFNRQLFFEAHEVLEDLWLEDRNGADGAFFKGLIQLAGAFVHIQKDRPGPATALFRLAEANLLRYPECHRSLETRRTAGLIQDWIRRLEVQDSIDLTAIAPRLELVDD